jgi:hypothetical protein
MTYPGDTELTGAACTAVMGANGTITIDVPISAVTLGDGVAPYDSTLYTVTTTTMTLKSAANTPSNSGGIGGQFFNLIDVVRAYNAQFGPTAVQVRSLSAIRRQGLVTLRWRTSSEAGLVGFRIYVERAGQRVARTRLIPAAGGTRGHTYAWRGSASSPGRYWLQLARVDGSRAWFGPAKG